jgi:hypothetical protein
MPELNADIPRFQCFVRKEFLYDQQRGHGEFMDCVVFGIASIPGRALGFHALLSDGAQVARIPIHALAHHREAKSFPVDNLQLFDCFAYQVSVHEFSFLSGLRCRTVLKDGNWYEGQYLFTIDWYGNIESESAGDLGHKNAHFLKLDNGNFAAQPNNRILWAEPSFIAKPFQERPDYLTQTRVWKCEGIGKWATEDSQKMFYEVMSK